MFDKSPTLSKYGGDRKRLIQMNLGHVPYLEPETEGDRRPMKIAVAVAVALHLAFFVIQMPKGREIVHRISEPKAVYMVKQVRFQPPPPRAEAVIPERKVKKRIIPIPDPTPEEPEPIRIAEIEAPDVDIVNDRDVLFGIPEGPPGPGTSGTSAVRLNGEITPPERIFGPAPTYTEDGRQSRTQGVVILEAIIDTMGNVDSVKVLKGLPNGLSEAAVQTAQAWKYKPALLDGEPVSVFFNLTIRYSLQ